MSTALIDRKAPARTRLSHPALVVPLLVYLTAFYAYPVAAMMFRSVTEPGWTLENFRRAFENPIYLHVLWLTFRVGLIVTMDRQMQEGQWADLGMFLQNVMLMAREHGLHSCPQEAWAVWHKVVRAYLKVPDNEIVFCGMAIGHADEAAPVNALVSERAPVEEFATFHSGK